MMSDSLHRLTASAAAERIRTGDLTSEALVKACLDRIDGREDEVGAWQYLDRDRVLGEARAADRSKPRGSLHGVPIGVKDTIDTFDMPTALGSPLYADRRPKWDAACVAAARAAGAIVLGKTVTTEFAYYHPGKTRNPYDCSRTPGGSSSGSAAAVADFMVPIAFGSQTAASVIRPSAFCGVFGYKPSCGEMRLSGVRPLAESLDTLGILARSVDDIALMRSVLVGEQRGTATAQPARSPKMALCRTAHWSAAESYARAAVEESAERFRQRGAHVTEVALPDHFAALADAQSAIMAYEAARNYVFEMTRYRDQVSERFKGLVDQGRRTSRDAYLQAKQAVSRAAAEMPSIMRDCDVLITPAAIGEAPAADTTGDPIMSRMWTALHVPILAVPVGKGPHGLPLAVQLVAANRADDLLLDVAMWVSEPS